MSARGPAWCVAAVLVVGLAACGTSTPEDGRAASTAPATTSSSTASATPTAGPAPPTPRASTPRPSTTAPPATRRPSPTATRSPARPSPDACALAAEYRGQDLEVVPTTSRIAVLTFDGGASSTGATSVLSTLSAKHAAATFFLTGDFVRRHPSATTAISSAHPVGNHTDTHPDLTTLSSTAVVDEIRRGAAAIRTGTGRAPGPWFRFPYGARDARTIDLVNDECDVAVRWTVDSLGWKGTSGGMTTAKVRDRVLAAARPGMIVLMHVGANPDDGTTLDASALPAIIDGLRSKGYAFVTLQQAL
ncbi:MAG TPA: polysaccharide deacetylase family protein [Ornithinibacter sp.]|nr:polysaccharide deacetylase family protein [Ornithinibacter sp.]